MQVLSSVFVAGGRSQERRGTLRETRPKLRIRIMLHFLLVNFHSTTKVPKRTTLIGEENKGLLPVFQKARAGGGSTESGYCGARSSVRRLVDRFRRLL